MNHHAQHLQHITRRHFLQQGQMGLGAVALGALMNREGYASPAIDVDDRGRSGPGCHEDSASTTPT